MQFLLTTLTIGTFRPPAIPLLTTDPFIQTWMRGDNSTSAQVSHWDGQEKQMVGLIRVDGAVFRFLGTCSAPAVTGAGAEAVHVGMNVAPGACDIANFANLTRQQCNERCYAASKQSNCEAYVMPADGTSGTCYLKSCRGPLVDSPAHVSALIAAHPPVCAATEEAQSGGVAVLPTRTIFRMTVAGGAMALNVTFLSTMFTNDYVRLSRPVSYITVDVASLDGKEHAVELYLDASAQHAVNVCGTADSRKKKPQQVSWQRWSGIAGGLAGVRIGNAVQNVLGSKGDKVNIDWGYLHVAAHVRDASEAAERLYAGSAAVARDAFKRTGALPTNADARMPRFCFDDLPALATQASLGVVGAAPVSHSVVYGYDDVRSIDYFNETSAGLWTRTYASIEAAMSAAYAERGAMLARSEAHDAALMAALAGNGRGEKYAQLCALSYRQTLAATKLVWNSKRGTTWNFLKEISTNGDMSTMDVIFPASPMLLYTNATLLQLLLIPVLEYAANKTYVRFTDAYSPHQLGTYPIGDSTTAQQENMPLENSGNMLFMLLGIVRAQTKTGTGDVSWIAPYFPMLTA
jgi:hypothetical protein